ncbi:MAG: hypothetical protein ACK5F7_23250 [Planctomycetaceae bacterium]
MELSHFQVIQRHDLDAPQFAPRSMSPSRLAVAFCLKAPRVARLRPIPDATDPGGSPIAIREPTQTDIRGRSSRSITDHPARGPTSQKPADLNSLKQPAAGIHPLLTRDRG